MRGKVEGKTMKLTSRLTGGRQKAAHDPQHLSSVNIANHHHACAHLIKTNCICSPDTPLQSLGFNMNFLPKELFQNYPFQDIVRDAKDFCLVKGNCFQFLIFIASIVVFFIEQESDCAYPILGMMMLCK